MVIKTRCPSCQALFQLAETLAGKKVRCQKCQQVFQVPEGEPEVLGTPTAPLSAPPRELPVADVIDVQQAMYAPERPAPRLADRPSFDALEDDEDLAPRRQRRAASYAGEKTGNTLLWVFGAFGWALLLMAGSVALGFMFFKPNNPAPVLAPPPGPQGFKVVKPAPPPPVIVPERNDVEPKNVDPGRVNQGPNVKGPGSNVKGFDVKRFIQLTKEKEKKYADRLEDGDPLDRVRKESHSKTYMLSMKVGITYTIDLTSADFDVSLRVEDTLGKVMEESDAPKGQHARIVFTPQKRFFARVICTSQDPRVGAFMLSVSASESADKKTTPDREK